MTGPVVQAVQWVASGDIKFDISALANNFWQLTIDGLAYGVDLRAGRGRLHPGLRRACA